MKTILFTLLMPYNMASYSQCDQLLKKYESMISKATYYLGKEIKLVNAGSIGAGVNFYTQADKVYFQVIVPVTEETCWDTEKSTVVLKLVSGTQVALPFVEATNDCDDVSPSGSFLINKSQMVILKENEVKKLTVNFQAYSINLEIPEQVNDDMMDPNSMAYPRKTLLQSISCLSDLGY